MRKIIPQKLGTMRHGLTLVLREGIVLNDYLYTDGRTIPLKEPLPLVGITTYPYVGNMDVDQSDLNTVQSWHSLLAEDSCVSYAPRKAASKDFGGLNIMTHEYIHAFCVDNRLSPVYTFGLGENIGRRVVSTVNGFLDITNLDDVHILEPNGSIRNTNTTSGALVQNSNYTGHYGTVMFEYSDAVDVYGARNVDISRGGTTDSRNVVKTDKGFSSRIETISPGVGNRPAIPVFVDTGNKIAVFLSRNSSSTNSFFFSRSNSSHDSRLGDLYSAYLSDRPNNRLRQSIVIISNNNVTTLNLHFVEDVELYTPIKTTNHLRYDVSASRSTVHLDLTKYERILRSVEVYQGRPVVYVPSPMTQDGLNVTNIGMEIIQFDGESYVKRELPVVPDTPEMAALERIVDGTQPWININTAGTSSNGAINRVLLHHIISTFHEINGIKYVNMMVVGNANLYDRQSEGEYRPTTVQYTLRIEQNAAFIVSKSFHVGFFGNPADALYTFVSSPDYRTLFCTTRFGVDILKFDESELVYVKTGTIVVDAVNTVLTPDNNLVIRDTNNDVFLLRSDTSDTVSIKFDNPSHTFQGTPYDINVAVSATNYTGERTVSDVELNIDGPAIFKDNGGKRLTVETLPNNDYIVQLTVTGYGAIHVTPNTLETSNA